MTRWLAAQNGFLSVAPVILAEVWFEEGEICTPIIKTGSGSIELQENDVLKVEKLNAAVEDSYL